MRAFVGYAERVNGLVWDDGDWQGLRSFGELEADVCVVGLDAGSVAGEQAATGDSC